MNAKTKAIALHLAALAAFIGALSWWITASSYRSDRFAHLLTHPTDWASVSLTKWLLLALPLAALVASMVRRASRPH